MDSSHSDDRPYLSADGQPLLRQYLVRAAKVYLCVGCWFGMWALLLLYSPSVFSVPTGPTQTTGVVAVMSGVVLAGVAATVLTIILVVVAVAAIVRLRNQSADEQDQSAPDATDSIEDEIHA